MMEQGKFAAYRKRAFDTVYSEEEAGFHQQLMPGMAQEYFSKLELPKSARILDVGCGQGQFLRIAQGLGYEDVHGVTMSEEDLHACGSLPVVIADMADLPFLDASFDFIWCRHTIEHSPYPLFALLEFERVMKPGAHMFIEAPCPDCQRQHEYNVNHYSILGARMWKALIEKAGLVAAHIGEFAVDVADTRNTATRWREKSYVIKVEKRPVDAVKA